MRANMTELLGQPGTGGGFRAPAVGEASPEQAREPRGGARRQEPRGPVRNSRLPRRGRPGRTRRLAMRTHGNSGCLEA